jgi:hypothetical protein
MEPIGPEVEQQLRRFGRDDPAERIAAAWPAAVGEGIARHAWPARLGRDGTLHVAAESATWSFELTQLAPRLLDRLRDVLPGGTAPAALRFAVGPLPERTTAAARPPRPAVEPTSADRAEAAALVAGIADTELRELVAGTIAASLARAQQTRRDDR